MTEICIPSFIAAALGLTSTSYPGHLHTDAYDSHYYRAHHPPAAAATAAAAATQGFQGRTTALFDADAKSRLNTNANKIF